MPGRVLAGGAPFTCLQRNRREGERVPVTPWLRVSLQAAPELVNPTADWIRPRGLMRPMAVVCVSRELLSARRPCHPDPRSAWLCLGSFLAVLEAFQRGHGAFLLLARLRKEPLTCERGAITLFLGPTRPPGLGQHK